MENRWMGMAMGMAILDRSPRSPVAQDKLTSLLPTCASTAPMVSSTTKMLTKRCAWNARLENSMMLQKVRLVKTANPTSITTKSEQHRANNAQVGKVLRVEEVNVSPTVLALATVLIVHNILIVNQPTHV
jgi:hypothetical protein